MIGCNLRFHPCIKKIKQLMDKKTIGKILSVQVESGSYLPDCLKS
jgi:predicted dehydrogenase